MEEKTEAARELGGHLESPLSLHSGKFLTSLHLTKDPSNI